MDYDNHDTQLMDKLSGVDYEESNVDRMMMASKTNTMTVTYTIRNN